MNKKGFYPHSYIDCFERFTENNYQQRNVFIILSIKNKVIALNDRNTFGLKTVLLLASIIENFRKTGF